MNSFNFSGKKILVTGASGFIGSHLCRRLRDSGATVHGISRTVQSSNEACSHWGQGDLADIEVVRDLLRTVEPDIVFHLASHVVGARNLALVLPTFNSNLVSTINLLTVATETNIDRIVLIGSLEEPEQSDTYVVPSSPYAASKWAGSGYARMFHELYQTPVTIARLFMVYGPAQQDLRKLIPYVTLSLLRKQPPKLTSGMRQIDWIYVGDVVDGLLAMVQAPNIKGSTIDLGSGVLVPIRTVVQKLINITDSDVEPALGNVSDRPMEQVRVANIADTYAKIGWKPTTSLDKGLEYTVDWYRELSDRN
ncbi:MAG: NAD(P)-dependent oxidoreductase [Deltaproteobacteria bacterium]|nr:NAD(P)-dependent oxidoreductase [Deltaproteobacteria bacterium]MBW2164942.1 NAD(P)-dependent oxidoreductase [Deltaproteobacteria bacterium]